MKKVVEGNQETLWHGPQGGYLEGNVRIKAPPGMKPTPSPNSKPATKPVSLYAPQSPPGGGRPYVRHTVTEGNTQTTWHGYEGGYMEGKVRIKAPPGARRP